MGFLNNLKENVKVGGYFIGTCYDGMDIFNYFKTQRERYKEIQGSEESTEEEEEEFNRFFFRKKKNM